MAVFISLHIIHQFQLILFFFFLGLYGNHYESFTEVGALSCLELLGNEVVYNSRHFSTLPKIHFHHQTGKSRNYFDLKVL